MISKLLCIGLSLILMEYAVSASLYLDSSLDSLYRLWDGRSLQVNAMWPENPEKVRFHVGGLTKITVADLEGPGVITMIHFAWPKAQKLNRDTVLRIYWDGETEPSVEAPLVDFFCDPNGMLEKVDSALVNKKRGWNCYLPMPFARSARIEVESQNTDYVQSPKDPRDPKGLWGINPCGFYVHYRTLDSLPSDAAYFHACWKRQVLLLGKEDYQALDVRGKGQWIGWNVTIRSMNPKKTRPMVDENVKFYLDGEEEPSIEWQGIEDGFGFSYGFPRDAQDVHEVVNFPYTGSQQFMERGVAAYRFCVNDRISFDKSLRMMVAFGKNERTGFRQSHSQPGNEMEFSSTAYWYQREPHIAFPPLPARQERYPAVISTIAE